MVTATVRDDDGASAVTRSSVLVVYDASAGRLTGAGWLPGASRFDKTTFGVDLRYAGGSTPVGNFLLAAQGGTLVLARSTFEWLVVQGPIATFRGTGTLVSGAAVGFQVTARDGKVAGDKIDRVRIRIWNRETDAVLFDTEPGAPDLAAPAVALQGGNVTLH
jgi:hypothetical protein